MKLNTAIFMAYFRNTDTSANGGKRDRNTFKVAAGLTVVLFLICTLQVNGQNRLLKGLVSGQGTPLSGATIRLYRLPDTILAQQVTSDQQGAFSFNIQEPFRYQIRFTAVGYQPYTYEVNSLSTVIKINLQPLVTKLAEVNISSPPNAVSVKQGKLTYNVEQSATATGSNVLELLRRTPGVNVDQDGNILLKGSAAVNVMLDGRMTYLSGQQLSRLLEGMNSGTVSKIEVITTPSAQFDAAGNAGIINIMSRRTNKAGYALNISSGMTISRYLLHSESLNGNVRTGKVNFFGSFGYNYRRRFLEETSTQLSGGSTLLRDGINPNQSRFYSYKGGVDINLSSRQQLGFSYTGTTDDWSKDAAGTLTIINNANQITSRVLSHDYAKEPFYNNIFNLNYLLKLDTLGKVLSADADYIGYRNFSDGYLNSNTYDPQGNLVGGFQQLNFHQPSIIHIRSFKADLTLPFKTWKYKAGVKYAAVETDNNFRYDSLANGVSTYAPSLSDHFQYHERIAAAYGSVSCKWVGTDLEAGLRAEQTNLDANAIAAGRRNTANYLSWFPSLGITQSLGKEQQLDLSVSRRINRPNYTDLNPVRYYIDKYALYQGNPGLVAETSWLSQLSYTWKDRYIASLSYNHSENFIGRTATVDPVTQLLTLSTGNFPHRDRLELQLIIPVTLAAFWEVQTTTTFSHTAYPVAQLAGPLTVTKDAVDLFVNQTFRLPAKITFELQTRYTSPDLNGAYMSRYYFTMDGGFKKSFLNKKLDARLAFADLFHTGWYWGYSLSDTLPYSYKNTPDSRRLSFSLVYHLGGKLTPGKTHRTEEQDRL
ncbi:outer membrane beta-barrel protein [Mucilaginibacter sp. KACC 22063]|uniref:outer membrane beta-barrel protein n=1 Tax=Mucilaginibacter sp. KACC 22063 TaxID=3025666 RepID=UPI0023662C5E|nr:outer membrane beta-barrel protein [Mucilaginibacter sp. KACC 22063]WDF55784.1 TonB-dependent receptor [Mucilaginibacter sp. KACC 22063]